MTGHDQVQSTTNMENLALLDGINLSDGHPRMAMTVSQKRIVGRLPDIFEECSTRPLDVIESEAKHAFFTLMGQYGAFKKDIQTRFCYSSSTAIDIIAKSLTQANMRVGMLHPTFDNLPDLVKGHGCELLPINEARLFEELEEKADQIDAFFMVTPNNPTGTVLDSSSFQRLCQLCKQHDLLLVVDSCFRAQVPAAHYDAYEIAEAVGVKWVIIEDTGKLWPLHELKCGFLSWPDRLDFNLHKNYSDLMLSASPVSLALIRDFARDAKAGGLDALRAQIRDNRKLLRSELPHLDFSIAQDSEISVDFAKLPIQADAIDLYAKAKELGVHLLPGEPFYWAARQTGACYMRFSLARDAETILAGIKRVRSLLVGQSQ